jgi:hypothetical protein
LSACVACGDAFTTGSEDTRPDGAGAGDAAIADGSVDTGSSDGPLEDRAVRDGSRPRDALSEEVGTSDGSGPSDASVVDGASLCATPCPLGFDCVLAKCVDRATVRFSAQSASPGNWADGYFKDLGGVFQVDSNHWVSGSSVDVWTDVTASTFEPSVFHNNRTSGAVSVNSMTIPAGALGLFPSSQGPFAVLQWTAPATGAYQVDAAFTGISTPPSQVDVGIRVNMVIGVGTSRDLNAYGGGNTFTYSQVQMLTAGESLYFYCGPITMADDPVGGVTLDAEITSQ